MVIFIKITVYKKRLLNERDKIVLGAILASALLVVLLYLFFGRGTDLEMEHGSFQRTLTPEEIEALKDTGEILRITNHTPLDEEIARTVVKEAEKYEYVDVYLLLSLMDIESNFEPKAVSHAGAVGIMQLMPITAEVSAEKLNKSYEREKLYDPKYNIKLASVHVNHLLELYDGDRDKALTAYNRGTTGLEILIQDIGTPESSFSRLVEQKSQKYRELISK